MLHNACLYRGFVASALAVVALASAAQAQQSSPLSAAVIRGSSVYSPLQLFEAWRTEVGRPVDRDCAQAVVASVQTLYERDGYARPEVSVDDVLLARGILRLDVSEPRITQVTVEGDAGPYRVELERISSRLEDMQPIRRDEVQQALGRMRALSGLTVNATTRRDEAQPNGHALSVQARFDPVDGLVRVSNRGTDEVGPAFVVAQAIANGLLSHGEKLGAFVTAATDADEYRGGGAFVDAPVGARNARLFVMGFGSASEPARRTDDQPVDRYVRDRATVRITQPLATRSRVDLALTATFEAEDFAIRRDGEELRDERLRVLQLGTRAAWRAGDATQYLATVEVRQGLDGLGAGLQAADLLDDPRRADFLLTRLSLVQLTRFGDAWSLRVDALAQHTGYVLPYSETFKVGGERLGRGFEVAEIAGDRGAGAKLELRRTFGATTSLLGRPSAYGFYDIGAGWDQDAGGRASAATAGIGLATQAGRFTAYLEVAKPLTRPDIEGRRSATVFGELSFSF
jgi:hemolysin activation/secretion protein